MLVKRIPTLHGFTALSVGSHRPGLFPRTMGDDYDDQEAANAQEMDATQDTSVSAQVVTAGGSPTSFNIGAVAQSGVNSILSSITPGAASSVLSTITNALGITKPKTTYVASSAPSTLPSWVLPAAGIGILALIVMSHKR